MEREMIFKRFERTLGAEIGAFRADMASEFATLLVEMATMRSDIPKWMLLFSILQVAAASAMTAFLLRTIATR